MHTEHWGPRHDATAPRALLLHGLTSSAATTWELAEPLAAAGWAVTAPDLPGHGRSGPASSYSAAATAEAVATLGGPWDLVVGHSLGGTVAVRLAVARPDLVGRLVLLDPAVVIPEALTEADARAAAEEYVEGLEPVPVAQIAAEHPHWHPRTVEARAEATALADPEGVRRTVVDNCPWDARAAVAALTVPTLMLLASEDTLVPAALAAELAAANPLVAVETVPGTTHSVHRDRPDLVVPRLFGR